MNKNHFYYINDQYFIDFPDPHLMQHKETIAGQAHDRPCFYAFEDSVTGLSWMIPLSSQVNKYLDSHLHIPVRINGILENSLIKKQRKFWLSNGKGAN